MIVGPHGFGFISRSSGTGLSYKDRVLQDGAKFYVKFDGQDPPEDIAGSYPISSTTGSPTLGVAGAATNTGGALSLDGSSWYIWDVNSSDLGIDGDNPRTLEVWAKPEQEGDLAVATFGDGDSNLRDFGLHYRGDKGTDTWTVQLWGDDLNFTVSNSVGNWHYFAIVYDGTDVIVFADAEQVSSKTVTLDTYSTQNLYIGNWESDTGSFGFDGGIDELALYDAALSQTKIQEHYDAGVGN